MKIKNKIKIKYNKKKKHNYKMLVIINNKMLYFNKQKVLY